MSSKQEKTLIRIIISALFCIIGILIPINIAKLLIFILSYLISGYDVLLKAAKNIFAGKVMNEKFLMSIATFGAFIIGEYPEAAAVMIFYQTGELFEGIAKGKSKKSIAALMELKPDVATVIRDGAEVTVPTEEVLKGEIIIVKAGERIPLDGEIISGNTSIDTSSITGESLPQDKTVGDSVFSSAVNLSGVITVRVTSVYNDSTLAKILRLTKSAAERKAKTESFISVFARYYTPIVVYSAFAIAVIPSLIFGNASDWIYRGLTFLVVSCPCALVVSVPMSFFGGIGAGAKKGILIRGSDVFEALSSADTAVFDKTGTLTTAEFSVTDVYTQNTDPETLLQIAAAAEKNSNHPIALAICKKTEGESKLKAENVTEIAGMGIKAEIDGETYYFGNQKLMKESGVDFKKEIEGTVIHISKGNEYLGYIVAEDTLKPEAKDVIKELKTIGIKNTVMLTGDTSATAENIAKFIGADYHRAELLPEDKVSAIEELIEKGGKTIFIGDGINDAPVLARSDVGITMGALGSDAAIEAADLVIMDDNLTKIPLAIKIARKTLRIARQNIAFAISVKIAILILSALGLSNMWLAVFGDVGVLVIAILNALRTLK